MNKQFKFEMKGEGDEVVVNFGFTGTDHLVNKVIGFLRAAGMSDEEIKNTFEDAFNGKWSNHLNSVPITIGSHSIMGTNLGTMNVAAGKYLTPLSLDTIAGITTTNNNTFYNTQEKNKSHP